MCNIRMEITKPSHFHRTSIQIQRYRFRRGSEEGFYEPARTWLAQVDLRL
jgi:hypothetical protein